MEIINTEWGLNSYLELRANEYLPIASTVRY